MNLNDRILWHFLEKNCSYVAMTSEKIFAPASSVWKYRLTPYRYPGFVCVIAIKEHSVLTRIDYSRGEHDHAPLLTKEWRRRSFNVFKFIEWVDHPDTRDKCKKLSDEYLESKCKSEVGKEMSISTALETVSN